MVTDQQVSKKVVQVVEYREDSGDRSVEGRHGCKDSPEVPAGAAAAERDEGRTPLADAKGLLRGRRYESS